MFSSGDLLCFIEDLCLSLGWSASRFWVPEDVSDEAQMEVEELDEVLIPELILAHKGKKGTW